MKRAFYAGFVLLVLVAGCGFAELREPISDEPGAPTKGQAIVETVSETAAPFIPGPYKDAAAAVGAIASVLLGGYAVKRGYKAVKDSGPGKIVGQ